MLLVIKNFVHDKFYHILQMMICKLLDIIR